MGFFKVSEDLKKDAMLKLLKVCNNFKKDAFKLHSAFESSTLSQNLKMTGVNYAAAEHEALRDVLIFSGKMYNTSSEGNIIVTTHGTQKNLNSFNISLNRDKMVIDLEKFDYIMSRPDIGLAYVELVDGNKNQFEILSKNFSKYSITVHYDNSLDDTFTCKAIDIKDFTTKCDYNFELSQKNRCIVYTASLTTILDCNNFSLKKCTEVIYKVPLGTKKDFLEPDEMFKLLLNTRAYKIFSSNILLDYTHHFSDRDYSHILFLFMETARRHISLLGKFRSAYDFTKWCEQSEELDEFLANCTHYAKLQFIKHKLR